MSTKELYRGSCPAAGRIPRDVSRKVLSIRLEPEFVKFFKEARWVSGKLIVIFVLAWVFYSN